MNEALGWVTMLAASESMLPRVGGMGKFLLKHGREFEPGGVRPKGVRMGRKQQCYHNSMRAMFRSDLIYADGYAFPKNGIIPVMHAWNVCPETGKVIDLTWKDGVAYWGLAYTRWLTSKISIETGYYGVIDNWMSQTFQRLFAGKLAEEKWRHPVMDKLSHTEPSAQRKEERMAPAGKEVTNELSA